MSTDRLIAVIYLAVSSLALLAQWVALRQLRRQRPGGGLVRTVACRVAASLLYVGVGVNALLWRWVPLQVTLAVYIATQITWLVNSRLDVRAGQPKRHRRPRLVTVTITRDRPRPGTGEA